MHSNSHKYLKTSLLLHRLKKNFILFYRQVFLDRNRTGKSQSKKENVVPLREKNIHRHPTGGPRIPKTTKNAPCIGQSKGSIIKIYTPPKKIKKKTGFRNAETTPDSEANKMVSITSKTRTHTQTGELAGLFVAVVILGFLVFLPLSATLRLFSLRKFFFLHFSA